MDNLKLISKLELKDNNGLNGKPLWILIQGFIYDVTSFKHPGGINVYLVDQSEDEHYKFTNVCHSSEAYKTMDSLLIGQLIE